MIYDFLFEKLFFNWGTYNKMQILLYSLVNFDVYVLM